MLRTSASCKRVEDARKLSAIEGRDEYVTRTGAARRGCGARRSFNATGDSTSEARRGRREIERSRARFLEISSAFLLDFCSRLIRYKAQTDNQNGREEQCWRLPGSLGGSTLRPAPRLLRGTARLQRRRVWRRRCTTVVTWRGRPPGRLRRGAGMQGMVVVAAAEEEAASVVAAVVVVAVGS